MSGSNAKNTLRVTNALLIAVVFSFPFDLNAQPSDAGAEIPDLTGIWQRRGLVEPAEPMQLKARAIGFSHAFDEVLSPRYDCSPAAAPFILRDPYNFAIEQQTDRVLLIYEKDDVVRTVWLEGHNAPEPGAYDYSIQGHSVGRYEGDQLVVETTKFVFDPVGLADTGNIPSSTLKTVTERYWREGDWLKANVVTEDPLILLAPYEFTFQWELTDVALVPYGCDPELARFPAEFFPPKYQDPDWVRLPADRPSIRP
ncbi:MAG: hypothetical protein ACR2QQ_00185 [Gammaproteobacteria bacterium]